MNILVACEMSGKVRNAFRNKGHEAYSCDIIPSLDNSPYHIEGNVLDILNGYNGLSWDLMIAHPPCTFITNAGVRHLYDHVTSKNGKKATINGVERWVKMHEACMFFRALAEATIDKICIENPIPHKHAKHIIGNYSQLIQPWQFGHGETKATCLWLKNLPLLTPTNIVSGREARIHKMGPSKDRAMLRSITYDGIAAAFAEQWG